jgi:starch synthase
MPIVSLVSRLAWQKGLDMLDRDLLSLPARFVLLGQGDPGISSEMRAMAAALPERFRFFDAFSEDKARLIYAGSDIFFMPSRFEPCGLGQMIAMRYGTLPVVRATGGLRDTVDSRSGWLFRDYKPEEARRSLSSAIEAYKDQAGWHDRQLRAMRKDFSWTASAKKYLRLYEKVRKAVDK